MDLASQSLMPEFSHSRPVRSHALKHRLMAALLLALTWTAAPLVAQAPAKASKSRVKTEELQWPAAPAEPRVKWVAEYRNEFDVGAKKRTGFMDRLTGKRLDSMGFAQPSSVAVDDEGTVFVGDTKLGIVGMDPTRKKMWLFSKVSPEAHTLATGLAVDSAFVYATDANQNLVTIYDKEGHRIRGIGGADGIHRPVGIAVDEGRNQVLVVNGGTHQVLVYDRSLKLIRKVGSRGEKVGQFNFPTYCCFLPGKGFAVVDTGNFRVQIFSPEGKFLSAFGKQGDYSGTFSRPKGIAVDTEGHLYVIDATFCNFQLFRIDGQILMFVGKNGVGPGMFQVPDGIAVGKDGSIWVADSLGRRVQRFQYLPSTKKEEPAPKKTQAAPAQGKS